MYKYIDMYFLVKYSVVRERSHQEFKNRISSDLRSIFGVVGTINFNHFSH